MESPLLDTHPTLTVVADARGNISNSEFSPDKHDIGLRFYVTATGASSQAQTAFADAGGTIIVEKQTVPDGAVGSFRFTGDAGATISDNGQIIVSNLAPGAYSITESDLPSGWELTSIFCDDAASTTPSTFNPGTRTATFQVDVGETVKCTFTNSRAPQLKLVKDVAPDTDPGKFDLSDSVAGLKVDDGGDGANSGFFNTTPGSHTVSELAGTGTVLGDYLSKVVCDSGKGSTDPGTSHTFSLAYGDQVTCTFANSRAPQLKLVKDVAPDNDPGKFDLIDSVAGLKVDDGGDGANSGFFNTTPGSHTVSELAGTGTSLGNYVSKVVCDSGKGSTDPGTSHILSLAFGDQVTCSFTNTRRGHIIVDKITVPSGDTTNFFFSPSGFNNDADFPLADATAPFESAALVPGIYSVAEIVPVGWDLTGLSCVSALTASTVTLDSPCANPTGHGAVQPADRRQHGRQRRQSGQWGQHGPCAGHHRPAHRG